MRSISSAASPFWPAPTDRAMADSRPYRRNVGIMVINAAGLVWAGKRIDNPGDAWQMPQGGIDKGENPDLAALRELEEETSISQTRVQQLAVSADWLRYDFPQELAAKLWKGGYRGQEQRWYLMRFDGDDAEINIDTDDPEFSEWKWMRFDELLEKIVPFKLPVYEAVWAEFGPLVEQRA